MVALRRRRAQILITGATGQVGAAIIAELDRQNAGDVRNYLMKPRDALDVSDFAEVKKQLELLKPDVIINCAGVSDWRAATTDRKHTWSTVVQGPDNLAKLGAFLGIPLIHLSCHSVFGSSPVRKAFEETDPVAPPNFLSQAQAFGEHAILRLAQAAKADVWDRGYGYWIVRTGPLFSPPDTGTWRSCLTRQAFATPRTSAMPTTMLADDLQITPTYVPHLAKALIWIAENRRAVPYGVYHLANEGITTPYEFAIQLRRAVDWQGPVFQAAPLSEITHLIGDRPDEVCRSTPLNCAKLSYNTPIDMPSWLEAIEEFATTVLA